MPEDPNPGGNPGAPAPTPAPAPDPAANAAFAEMRTKLAAAEKEKTELAERLTNLERKDMDEKTRLTAELEDAKRLASELTPLKDAHGRFQTQLEQACANEIAAIPEDKRAAVEAVVNQIPLEGRLTAIQQMRTAIGSAPLAAGTNTQPGQGPNGGLPGSPETAKPIEAKDLRNLGWTDAMKGHVGNSGPMMPDIKSLVDAAVKEQLAAAK